MATRLTPYLNFDGETGEAMAFYHAVFGGDLSVMRFGDLGRRDGVDPDGVMHATLSTPGGLTLMASDLPPGTRVESGNTFSVCLSGDDAEELAGYWDALTEGGQVQTALEPQVWGDTFGLCVDRFGVAWMVNIAGAADPV